MNLIKPVYLDLPPGHSLDLNFSMRLSLTIHHSLFSCLRKTFYKIDQYEKQHNVEESDCIKSEIKDEVRELSTYGTYGNTTGLFCCTPAFHVNGIYGVNRTRVEFYFSINSKPHCAKTTVSLYRYYSTVSACETLAPSLQEVSFVLNESEINVMERLYDIVFL